MAEKRPRISPKRHKNEHDGLLMYVPSEHEAAKAASGDRLQEDGVCGAKPERYQLDLSLREVVISFKKWITYNLGDGSNDEAVKRLYVGQNSKLGISHEAPRR